MPGRATNMGDGWETRRRRGPGYDWAIVRLGTTGHGVEDRDRHQPLQGQLPRKRVARGLPRTVVVAAATSGRPHGPRSCRGRPQAPSPALFLAGAGQGRARSRTSGSTSFLMAASAGCASMDTWQAIDRGRAARRRGGCWLAPAARPAGSSGCWASGRSAAATALLSAARAVWDALDERDWREASPTTRRSATARRCASDFRPPMRCRRASRRASTAPARPSSTRSPTAIAATKRGSATSSSSARRAERRRDARDAARQARQRARARDSDRSPANRPRSRRCDSGSVAAERRRRQRHPGMRNAPILLE